MTKRELNSTERLLDIIKGKGQGGEGASAGARDRGARSSEKRKLERIEKAVLRSGNGPHASIIIGKDAVSLVLPGTTPAGEPYVEGIRHVPCPGGVDIFSQQFEKAVSEALSGIGRERLDGVWCALPDSMVDVRYLKLPKAGASDLDQAAYWTYKKEAAPENDDILFDYYVCDEITDRGVDKLGVCAYGVSRSVISRVRTVLEDARCTVEGITSGAFALYSLIAGGCLRTDLGNLCCLHVGRDSSAIHLFSGKDLVLVRQIRAGLSSLAENLPSEGGGEPALRLEGREGETDPKVEELLRRIDENPEGEGADDMLRSLGPAIERIARQIERTINYFRQNIKPEKVSAVLVCGRISRYRPFVRAIAEFLGMEAYTPADLLSYDAGVVHSEKVKEEDLFLAGLGLVRASLGKTPNFLFTRKDRDAYDRALLLFKSSLAAVALAVALCLAAASWQGVTLFKLKRERVDLVSKLPGGADLLDQSRLGQLSALLRSKQEVLKKKVGKIEPRVVVGEIVNLMPSDVRLSNLDVDLGENRQVSLSGYVFGKPYARDSLLASYVLELSKSPLFEQVSIKNRKEVGAGADGALEFSATIKLSGS